MDRSTVMQYKEMSSNPVPNDWKPKIARYNFSNMPCVKYSNGETRFLLVNENSEIAKRDILFLNQFINHAWQIDNTINPINFDMSRVYFKPTKQYQRDEIGTFIYDAYYNHMVFNLTTPTGKPSKYPYKLIFAENCNPVYHCTDEEISANGEIYYTQNGIIGKARITRFYKRQAYTIYINTNDHAELSVTKIEKY